MYIHVKRYVHVRYEIENLTLFSFVELFMLCSEVVLLLKQSYDLLNLQKILYFCCTTIPLLNFALPLHYTAQAQSAICNLSQTATTIVIDNIGLC